ncbi:hypothetical protein [Parafrankia sp. BMG5.11]|uniref:hypothetical protein n=1 Tax=Parafrankia sp. BMG5.11 TaxID=222540 RepID=UPI00103A1690|nr:hypothetical protein [Parafrankia sp. BMG5.11]TCJ38675.1 hypothetical protein E0504_12650 [Parafrankia sp. BMG5.11]
MNDLMVPGPVAPPAARRGGGPAPLVHTAAVTTGGTLAWVGWVWLLAALGYGAAVAVISFVGERDTSLWQVAVATWQRWLMLAAGTTMTTTFAPMLITNGVIRARLARSVVVCAVAVGLLGGLFLGAGFAVESVVFAGFGWPRALSNGVSFDSAAAVCRLGAAYGLGLSAWFVSGWLAGLARHVRESAFAILLVPALVPAVLAEGLVLGGVGAFVLPFIPDWRFPFAVGAPVVVTVLGLACVAGVRASREISLVHR